MNNIEDILDDLVLQYIQYNFATEFIPVILDSFTILARFNYPQYDSGFVDLITQEQELDKDQIRDSFVQLLRALLIDVLEQHHIKLALEMEVTLGEVNEVLFFLLLVQDLEDTSVLSYRLYAGGSSKQKLVELLSRLSRLKLPRAMEIVEFVDDKIIEAMKMLVRDNEETTAVDKVHLRYWNEFISFTGASDCLGKQLRDKGFFGLTVQELLELSLTDPSKQVEQAFNSSSGQAALDALSFLLLCSDAYQTPLVYLENNPQLFTPEIDKFTRLKIAMTSILIDFSNYLTANKQGD